MATVTSSNPAVVDLAAALAGQLSTGGGSARATIGDRSAAFDWTGGATPWPGVVFASSLVDGLTFRATTVSPSGTPAKKVARGADKPNAVTITTATKTLDKFAGYGELLVEDILDTDALIPAVENVLIDQCLDAFNTDIGTALADAALSATGADWQSAILAGIATLPSASLLVVAPDDLASIVSPSSGYQVALSDAVPVVFGLSMIALPGLAAGTAYVMKASALTVFDSKVSPAVIVDPYGNTTNTVRVIADVFAYAQLTAPGAVVAVTVTAAP